MTDRHTDHVVMAAVHQQRIESLARSGLVTVAALWAVAIVLIAAACAPIVAPRDLSDSLAYAEGQVQAVVRSCTTLNDERRITLEQAVRCRTITEQAFVAIDAGRAAARFGDLTKAQAQLAAARSLLLEVERITGSVK